MFSGATVLANGMLALILDLTAMAVRAGVRPTGEGEQFISAKTERPHSELGRVEPAQIEMESAMVIYETWKRGFDESSNRRRMAMPLSAVERIERVTISEIEYAGGRAVLQYGGELLPLEDEDELLLEMRATNTTSHTHALPPGSRSPGGAAVAETWDAGGMATVLICQRPGTHAVRRVGMVVRRVLDVSAGTLLPSNAGLCDSQLAMVKNRVTMVHCESMNQVGGPAMPLAQEVA